MSKDSNPPWPMEDEGEHTVVRPTPGGRRPPPSPARGPVPQSRPPPSQAPAYGPPLTQGTLGLEKIKGLNPLVRAAAPLLSLLVNIRNTRTLSDLTGLRSRVEHQIQAFERDAAQGGIDPETIYAARYCLCTAVDEAVLNTPWGAESAWRDESLLSVLHRERWGGEKFFLILERRAKDPGPNLYILELLYLCLALGFQGKYHVLTGGQRTLDGIIGSVYETIRRQRGEFERDLSPRWEGEAGARTSMTHPVPLWVLVTLAAAFLLTTYIAFSYLINDASAPTFQQLAGLIADDGPPERKLVLLDSSPAIAHAGAAPERDDEQGPSGVLVTPTVTQKAGLARSLSGFLAPEINANLVDVIDGDKGVTIRIIGSGLFASGRGKVTGKFLPTIQRIATALAEHDKQIPGGIQVVGHTDNIPMKRSLRFQDNWHLSRARAQSVAKILSENKGISRPISEQGQGDTQPLVANDTRANRAKNRRVEILVEK